MKRSDLDILEDLKETREILGQYLLKINFEGLGKKDKREFQEMMDFAIKSCGKEIPVRILSGERCPICMCINFEKTKYCPYCGQALDWSIGK